MIEHKQLNHTTQQLDTLIVDVGTSLNTLKLAIFNSYMVFSGNQTDSQEYTLKRTRIFIEQFLPTVVMDTIERSLATDVLDHDLIFGIYKTGIFDGLKYVLFEEVYFFINTLRESIINNVLPYYREESIVSITGFGSTYVIILVDPSL